MVKKKKTCKKSNKKSQTRKVIKNDKLVKKNHIKWETNKKKSQTCVKKRLKLKNLRKKSEKEMTD